MNSDALLYYTNIFCANHASIPINPSSSLTLSSTRPGRGKARSGEFEVEEKKFEQFHRFLTGIIKNRTISSSSIFDRVSLGNFSATLDTHLPPLRCFSRSAGAASSELPQPSLPLVKAAAKPFKS
eukprot:17204-Heterococcus_DN1.PRE.1